MFNFNFLIFNIFLIKSLYWKNKIFLNLNFVMYNLKTNSRKIFHLSIFYNLKIIDRSMY